MRTKLILLLAVLALFALPCFADWGQAESPDFALDTTIPEPALIAAAISGLRAAMLLRDTEAWAHAQATNFVRRERSS
ncbi:MAG: hypothetical protein NTV22_00555 [bacterium]|nr:hypothetical protein [bacterium]